MTLAILSVLVGALQTAPSPTTLREGSSPQLAVDTRGVIRLIFGRKDTIFAATSRDNGVSFSPAAVVGIVPGMHLGSTRGPTIASSRSRSVVVAIDTRGDIFTYELDHATDRWHRGAGTLNDSAGSAPEGLATVAADDADHFYAVWLDLRQNRQNQVYFAPVPARALQRVRNRVVYSSPDGHVCECCRPSIAVAGKRVAVMFRNWLGGNRDMYVATSSNGGRTFTSASKLGDGTWKLDACPMDGGGLVVDRSGKVGSVWRRELTIYFAEPGKAETVIAEGRSPMIARAGKRTYIVWQEGTAIKLKTLGADAESVVGEGRLPQVLPVRDGSVLVAWENAGKVFYSRQ